MAEKKLGRGLDALLGGFSLDDELTPVGETHPNSEPVVEEIAIAMIDNNLNQPRKQFDQQALEELAESIKEYGVIQPILVTPVGNRFMIVAGERRWRAAKMAGLVEIPAVVKMFNGKQIAEIAIIENLQRDNLNDMELAFGIKQLMDEHHLTQEKVAERLSKPRSTIANLLRLIALPRAVQRLLETRQLTLGHALRLLSVTNAEQQIKYAEQAVADNLSVRALGELIDGKFTGLVNNGKSSKPAVTPEIREQEKILSRAVGTKVKIQGTTERGKIILAYHAAEELNRLVEYLKNHNI